MCVCCFIDCRFLDFADRSTLFIIVMLLFSLWCCVSIAGEIVCAGAANSFEIFVWALQTGRVLETLSGHTGPISSLSFSPLDGQLASCSWDCSVRVWDLFARHPSRETFIHTSDVLAVAYRPDGRQLCSATLDG